MEITTTSEIITELRKTTVYDIAFEVRTDRKTMEKVKLTVSKWIIDDEYDTDSDTEFDIKSQEIYDSLDEDTQIEVWDYISEL